MVIDTSALLAILFAEPEAPRIEAAIRAAQVREVGTPTYVETAAVLRAKRGPRGLVAFDALLEILGVTVVPLTVAGAHHAREAYDRYGRGRGAPPAVLNFGDCLAYGVAMDRGEPLLFKGEDFVGTAIAAAPY
ncbi:MAG TPA: type II toxin-antitoxin system VapC family toxin [Gemmatimonadaceae bacterium]|nr:type II toxin-antitoxin system VapC family toxin [Gemmatimonadaceae bacterium]